MPQDHFTHGGNVDCHLPPSPQDGDRVPRTPSVTITDTRPDRSRTYAPPKPILDRLLVRKIENVESTNFEIPDKFRQQSRRGEVLAVGDGVMLGTEYVYLTDFVNVGDIVTFSEYTAEKFNNDNDEIYIIRIQDIRVVEKLQK